MHPTYGQPQRFKPLRYKSFSGEPDPEEMRERAEYEAFQARILSETTPIAPPPPTFTEDELEAVRQRAFEDGRAQGAREERDALNREAAEREAATQNAMAALQGQLQAMGAEQVHFILAQKSLLSQLALHIAQKVAGEALAGNPLIEIEGMIGTALQQLTSRQPLKVYVHPTVVRYMESIYAEKAVFMPAESQRVTFLADPMLPHTDDCRVEWGNGSMRRSQTEIWEQIQAVLLGFDPLAAMPPMHLAEVPQAEPEPETIQEIQAETTAEPAPDHTQE